MIDDKDAAILDALAADSRAPLKAIAAAVGLSRSSVQERIARLVADGTIAGFSIRRGAEQKGARAYMLVATAGAQCAAVAPRLLGIAEITRCDSVAGETDMVLTVEARDAAALQAVRDRIASVDGVTGVVTMPVMVARFAR
ncbi:MAG: Lrp/AsnC family transcriptional regulator [Myxococcales bacterium]|nr:Lrp/AsnC family transcriptional regulator [Myxococcales bacterium]